jgi:TolB-like protein/Tfp pilus assembly protein PilF
MRPEDGSKGQDARREKEPAVAVERSRLGASLAELRRRHVFRVGVGYAVAAFAFLQLMSSISGAVELTPATMRYIVLGVLGGFPLALFLAWAYDLTPHGIERTVEPEATRSSRTLELTIIGVLTLAVSGIGYLIYRPGAPAPIATAQAEVADRSIAVLPFVNLSDDAANDYFGDGLAEEILNVLATVPNLRVAARTSSFAYKGRNEDVRRIGNELNVATVLEGSVRKSGDKVRITVQLINVADGFHLWSQNFDRTLSDIFTIQDEIARAVAEALKVRLLGQDASAAKLGGTGSVNAYDLYLLGRHNMQQRTEQGLLDAIRYFEQALAADPEYARAWSGLADAYNLLIGYGNLTQGKALAKAEAAALRALALDPKLAEAHASLGLIRSNQGRGKEGLAELETAIKLDPGYAPAWVWYGTTLGSQKRDAEKLAAYEKAFQLDPSLPPAVSNLAGLYNELGRYRDAFPLAERMVRLKPADASLWHAHVGEGLLALGAPAEAIAALRRALEVDPRNVKAMGAMARAYLQLDDLDAAQRWVGFAQRAGPRQVSALIARVNLAIARKDFPGAAAAIRAELGRSQSSRNDPVLNNLLHVVLVLGGQRDAAAVFKDIEQRFRAFPPGEGSIEFGPYIAWSLQQAKRPDDARKVIDDALAWIDGRVAIGSRRPDHQYTAAQAYALSGRPAEAVAALSIALQRGWTSARFARQDPLLTALRDDPAFVALLETADAALAAQREALAKAPPAPFDLPAEPGAVALTAAELDRLAGTYVAGDTNTLQVVARAGDHLEVTSGDLPPVRLAARSALEFREDGSGDQLSFVLGPDGVATHALVRSQGGEQRLKRVAFELPKLGQADPSKYRDYPGTYAFESGFKVHVALDGKRLLGRQDDQANFEMQPERDDVFFIPGAALRLIFVRDEQGAVKALRIQQVDFEVDGPRQAPATVAP